MSEVVLCEWETARPEPGNGLYGRFLSDGAERDLAARLTDTGRLGVVELARGIEIRATSFVGRIRLGGFTVTVRPKIQGPALLRLFRYAYGLRNVQLHGSANYGSSQAVFQDLLINQLLVEAVEVWERGLQKEYECARADLASPRGRIDFAKYAKNAVPTRTGLPCIFHPRTEDTLLNQFLLAGLNFAARIAVDRVLKADVRHLAKQFAGRIGGIELNAWALEKAMGLIDRRTSAYRSAFSLIQILMEGEGASLDPGSRVRLPGFLFDMNRFFQALVSRFLHEHLPAVDVKDEFRLKGMFGYDPDHNPLRRQDPILRPDFVLTRDGSTVAVLDAKYRDLGQKESLLPRDMLYQLALYALGRSQGDRRSVILYPSADRPAPDQHIRIREPSVGVPQATVVLRPVDLGRLCKLIDGGRAARNEAINYSEELALR